MFLLWSGVKKWGIVGIGLMAWDSKMYHILKEQDTLFTLLSRGHTGSEARVVGSIVDFMFAPEDHQAVIDKVSSRWYNTGGVWIRGARRLRYDIRLLIRECCTHRVRVSWFWDTIRMAGRFRHDKQDELVFFTVSLLVRNPALFYASLVSHWPLLHVLARR